MLVNREVLYWTSKSRARGRGRSKRNKGYIKIGEDLREEGRNRERDEVRKSEENS